MSMQLFQLDTVIDLLKYHEHNWTICVDLKMVNFLLVQQRGFIKYPCYLCMWDSRAQEKHWKQKECPIHETQKAGMPNIINDPIASRENVIYPPLHIKLSLMKQFVKALNTDGECFQHIFSMLPGLSFKKIKAGVFNGPQICALVRDQEFARKKNHKERTAWLSFVAVMANFLGNKKADNYETLVANMLSAFRDLECNMSVKLHYLYSHLYRSPENLGAVSDKQGERFHQDLKTMEERYQGGCDKHMKADYCLSIKRECPETVHKRNSYKQKFMPE